MSVQVWLSERNLHISAQRAEIEVRLRRAVAGNCPPDSCIEMFESATLSATTKKPLSVWIAVFRGRVG